MRFRVFRGLILGTMVAALAIPAGFWNSVANAAQQSGPQKAPPQPTEPKKEEQKKEQEPEKGFSITVEVPLVTVDVVATTNSGGYLTGLQKENFRVLEDGVPQVVTNFSPTEAPITIVILMEFSKLGYYVFAGTAKMWAYEFLGHLKKDDWVALVTFDMRTRIQADFTQNKSDVQDAIQQQIFPNFTEANLFDAVLETLDRLKDVKGKKSILILASGYDTFSKATFDKALAAVKQTDVTIFSVGVGKELIDYLETQSRGAFSKIDYVQAENHLRVFSRITGGHSWFPRFQGEIPGIFSDVANMLRFQYSLGYAPSNRNRDGKYRKIKVELVKPDGTPLEVLDQKGKKVKYQVYAREGYTLPKGVAEMRTGMAEVAKN